MLQHVARHELGLVVVERRRFLGEDRVLLVAAHLGDRDVVSTEFLRHHVEPIGGALYARDELVGSITAAGSAVEVERHRGLLANEFDSQRAYLLARRTAEPPNDP